MTTPTTGQDAAGDGFRAAQGAWDPALAGFVAGEDVTDQAFVSLRRHNDRIADLTAERDEWERRYHDAMAAGVADVERLTHERDTARGFLEAASDWTVELTWLLDARTAKRDEARASVAALVEALTETLRRDYGEGVVVCARCKENWPNHAARYGVACPGNALATHAETGRALLEFRRAADRMAEYRPSAEDIQRLAGTDLFDAMAGFWAAYDRLAEVTS